MRAAVVIACCLAFGAVAVLALGRSAAPRPVFTRTPDARATSRTADFGYRVALRHPRFRCSLDRGRWSRCPSRYRAVGLTDGRHVFCVRARAGVRRSRVACYRWTVGAPPAAFRMAATAVGALLPGGDPVPVDVAFTNPGPRPITVTAADVEVAGADPTGCAAAIRVVRGLAAAQVIPAGSTRSLSGLGVPSGLWPQLAMVDTGVDQSACRGAIIRLALTGSASG